jgi:hypothetical protein
LKVGLRRGGTTPSGFRRCKENLKPNGLVFVKDNLATANRRAAKEEARFFVEDRGLCRVYSHDTELFAAAGLTLVETVQQDQWPHYLCPVFCFVLK